MGCESLTSTPINTAGLISSIAYGAAVEVARAGAEKASDLVDKKMQEEFDKIADINSKTLLMLFARDLLMGIIPILILWILPKFV